MKPAGTQSDKNMNFDGMESIAPKGSKKYAHNAWSGHSNDGRLVNKGRGPTTGNQGYHNAQGGKSVTKDSFRAAPTSALPSVPAQGSVRDNINRGSQVRNPGGTRAWDPKKTQNYNGNPDMIRAKQTGGPDYGAVTKGSKPNTAAGQSDFNYGPKSQY